jgi:Fe-S oxidoreductase
MYLMVTYILGIYVFDEKTVAYKINAWLHILVILAFLDLIPRSKHLHLLFSLFTTFLKDFELARIKPLHLDLEADEETWELGAETLKDLSKFTALCAFTCVECGRCYDQCPARNTGKKLDPKQLMLDLRESYLKGSEKAFVEDELFNSVIWQCTTCGACTFQCPVGIDQVIPIIEMRRGSVANSVFPDTLRPLFDNLESVGNPWLYQPMDAATFLAENEFPDYEKGKVLYWMGCMARYDAEYRKVALAFKKLLDSAGVNWGVIVEETCTGDAARRAGNELLFQSLAGMNIEKLNEAAPELIVTTCPHCMRTLREYKDLGLKEDIRIIHHTQYLTDLISDGKLKIKGKGNGKVAYHDACYLSRYGDDKDYVNPRTLLRKAGVALTEPKRAKRLSFCCGAGGGMLFTEETEGTRVNHDRVDELLKTGMQTCATACPFCQMMIRDGLGDKGIEGMPVRDVAQILAEYV